METENYIQITEKNIMHTDLFIELEKMRSLQIRYFKTRDSRALSLSIKKENKVDRLIDQLPEAYTEQEFFGAFYSDVAQMRTLQKSYFATKSPSVLDIVKRQEKKVDALITKARNPKMF